MKKLIVILVFIFSFIFLASTISFIVFLRGKSFDELCRQKLTPILFNIFGRETYFESIEPYPWKIVFNNPEIANEKFLKDGQIIKAKKIIIKFNPLKFVLSRGDFQKSITEITGENAEINLIRKRDNRWNILDLFTIKKGTPPLTKIKLCLKNSILNFSDETLYEISSNDSVTLKITGVFGEAIFNENEVLKFSVFGNLIEDQLLKPVKFFGFFDLRNNNFKVKVETAPVNIKNVAKYIFQDKEILVDSGTFACSLEFLKEEKKFKSKIPLLIKGNLILDDVSLIYKNSYKVSKIRGTLNFQGDNLDFSGVTAYYQNALLNCEGIIKNFDDPFIDLSISSEKTSFKEFLNFSFFENLPKNLEGNFDFFVNFSGSLKNLTAKGFIYSASGKIQQAVPYKNLNLSFKYLFSNGKLEFNLKETEIFKGNLSLKGFIDFSDGPVKFNSEIFAKKLNLSEQKFIPGFKGFVDFKGFLVGNTENYSLNIDAEFSKNSNFYFEPIKQASIKAIVSKKEIKLDKCELIFNEKSYITASGKGEIDNKFFLDVNGRNIHFEKPALNGFVNRFNCFFDAKISGLLNKDIFNNPENFSLQTKLKLRNGLFFGQAVSFGEIDFLYSKGFFEIKNLYLRERNSELKASGNFKLGETVSLNFSSRKIFLSDLKILSFYLSPDFRKLEGKGAFQINVTGDLPREIEKILSPEIFDKIKLNGRIVLDNSKIGEQLLDKAEVDFNWKDQLVNFESFKLSHKKSFFELKGSISKKGDLNFFSIGTLNLGDFDFLFKKIIPWLKKYDELNGEISYSGTFNGVFHNPSFYGELKGQNIKFNQIEVENLLAPSIIFENQVFYFEKPLTISQNYQKKEQKYELIGKIDFSPLVEGIKNQKFLPPIIDAKLTIIYGRLETILNFGQNIYNEVVSRLKPPSKKQENFTFSFPELNSVVEKNSDKNLLLYNRLNSETKGVLKNFQKFKENISRKKTTSSDFLKNLTGEFSGEIEIKGKINQPRGFIRILFKNINFHESKIEKLFIKGSIEDKNLDDNVYNPFSQIDFEIDNCQFLEANFSSISGNFNYADGVINPLKISFFMYDHKAELTGKMPIFVPDNEKNLGNKVIDLTLTINKNPFKFYRKIFKDWEWQTGECKSKLFFYGKPSEIFVDGNISVSGAKLKHTSIYNEKTIINDLNSEIIITKNFVNLKYLNFKWVGKNTRNKVNNINLTGQIVLNNLFTPGFQVIFNNLRLADTAITCDFPLLYVGYVGLKNITLNGVVNQSFFNSDKSGNYLNPESNLPVPKLIGKEHPDDYLTMRGEINLFEGSLVIPESEISIQTIPVNLDLKLKIGPHLKLISSPLFVTGRKELSGLISKGILTGVNLEIAEETEPISINGNLNNFYFEKKLTLKGGEFSILGRSFVLLKPLKKRLYSKETSEITDNYIDFRVKEYLDDKGNIKKGQVLYLQLIGETEITKSEISFNGGKEKRNVLAIISGPVGNLDVSFEEYRKEAGGHYELVSRYDLNNASAIVKLLMPEILSTFVSDNNDRYQALAEFSSRQIQAIFQGTLRPIEEKIESSAGLDEFKLEYDIGDKLASSLFDVGFDGKRRLGLSIGKSLILDKLYLRVKYAQDFKNLTKLEGSLLTYQLIYWLNHNYSINFSREIDEVNQNLLYNDSFIFNVNYQF